ncbi:DUF2206 domain-containing protein [Chloroflexota bacterium]
MIIPNPLTPNDWKFKHFLWVLLTIQALVLLGIGPLAGITPIRQPLGLIYLLFVPGVIILRIARIHKIGPIKTLLFSVGLSIATVMLAGLVMNTLLPTLGISEPLSTIPLAIGITVVVVSLCLLAWFRDRKFGDTDYVDVKDIFSVPVLLLCLLPVMSILGTQLVNFYDNNILLMLLIALIALVVILAGFTRLIPERYYPWAVFTITLSVLLYRSLISQYISGFDIHGEYASAALVQSTGYWEPSNPALINGLLSINVLPATVSDISGMSLTLVYKTMYPLFFSIAYVGLYRLFRNQTNARVAFFAAIFIGLAWRVYYDIVLIPRQLIASVFLVSSVFLIVEGEMPRAWRALFLAIFGFALVLSHYGMAYIYIAILICSAVAEFLVRNIRVQRLWNGVRSRLGGPSGDNLDVHGVTTQRSIGAVSLVFVLLIPTLAFTWYLYTAGGAAVQSLGADIADFTRYISAYFFSGGATPTVGTEIPGTAIAGILSEARDVIVYLQELLIIIGCFVAIWGLSRMKLCKEYLFLCTFPIILFVATLSSLSLSLLFVSLVFLVFALFITVLHRHLLVWLTLTLVATLAFAYFFPGVAAKIAPPSFARLISESGSDADRLQHIALLLLAPFLVIGVIAVIKVILKSFTITRARSGETLWAITISILLACIFLMDTGFAWQVTGNYYPAPVLNQAWVKEQGNVNQKAHLYNAITMEQDVYSAEWLRVYRVPDSRVYATFDDDYVHPLASYGLVPDDKTAPLTTTLEEIPEDSYVYLQYLNVVEGIGTIWDRSLGIGAQRHLRYDIADATFLWEDKNMIYSNGGSEIYK